MHLNDAKLGRLRKLHCVKSQVPSFHHWHNFIYISFICKEHDVDVKRARLTPLESLFLQIKINRLRQQDGERSKQNDYDYDNYVRFIL